MVLDEAAARDWASRNPDALIVVNWRDEWRQPGPKPVTQQRFRTKPEARCLACHGTGEAPAGPTIAVEVGCEACHGAGAHYAEDDLMRNLVVARALGLADLSTAKARATLCAQCHAVPTRGKLFDPTAPVHVVKKP